MTKICPVCDFQNDPDALFCASCSFDLSTVQPTDADRQVLRLLGEDFSIAVLKKAVLGREGIAKEHFLDKAISRKHLKIFFEQGHWYIEDLNSANGTYLNKNRILPLQTYQVSSGDEVTLANKVTLHIKLQNADDDTVREEIVDDSTYEEDIVTDDRTMHKTVVLPISSSFVDSSSLSDNEVINGYKVQKHLASGGESDTYVVEKDDVLYVLKFYRLNMLPKLDLVRKIKEISDKHGEHLVKICDFWEEGKKFYEVYEYCTKGNLDDFVVRNKEVDFKNTKVLFDFIAQINEGLKVLHNNQILHRDLKPSNILLREDMSVVLSDFGIAKGIESSTIMTKNFKGSYRYSAPETLMNHFGKKSDYWSLGIIAYELYFGKNPFEQMTINAIFAKLLDTNDLTIPQNGVDPQVLVLLQGLLQKDPLKRWGGQELDNFLNNIRNYTQAPSHSEIVIDDDAEWQDYGFDKKEQEEWQRYDFSAQEAHEWVAAGFTVLDAAELKKVGITVEEAEFGRKEGLSLHDMIVVKRHIRCLIQQTKAHYGSSNCVAYSDTDSLLASGGNDYAVKVWNEVALNQIESFEYHTGYINAVAFSPDGRIVASASQDKSIKLWDIEEKKMIASLEGHHSSVDALVYSGKGSLLVSAGLDTYIHVWDLKTQKIVTTFSESLSGICSLSLSYDDKYLAGGSEDGTLYLWDMEKKNFLWSIESEQPDNVLLSFHPSKHLLAYTDNAKFVKILDVTTQREIATFEMKVTSLAFCASGEMLALGREDGSVILWEYTRANSSTLKQNLEESYLQDFDMSNKNLFAVLDGDTIEIWSKTKEQLVSTIKMTTLSIKSLAFSKNNRYLACAKSDGFLQIWESTLQKNLQMVVEHGFRLQELLGWFERGFDIYEAKKWRDTGFDQEHALKWKEFGFLPDEAKEWSVVGFNAEEAKEWKFFKVLPHIARALLQSGMNVTQLERWIDAGFSLSEIQEWYLDGFSLEEAEKWKMIEKTPESAKKYRKFGFLGYIIAKFF